MKKALASVSVFLFVALMLQVKSQATGAAVQLPVPPPSSSAKVDPLLQSFLSARPVGSTAPVIISYNNRPTATELNRLRAVGIRKGFVLNQLPMVIADMSFAQLGLVRNQPRVVSVWGNRVMKTNMNESRPFIGVPQMMADREVTSRNANNPGLPISGKGVGIGYLDTGIDGTLEDLKFGSKVKQNVLQPLAQGVVSDPLLGLFYLSISDLIADSAPGFVPPIYVENLQTTDLESGHGTHGAGCAAGTGAHSGGHYGGVAPGAHLVGVNIGDDFGLPTISIVAAFDYMMVNQFAHNIRVLNNSWGSSFFSEGTLPEDPINIATRAAHDANMVVVFAAGNGGDVPDAINPYSTMPWTISVAAGEKNGLGTPAGFSSRGINNGTGTDVAGMPADPNAQPNLRPDITAPGVRITSTHAHAPAPFMTALSVLNDDAHNVPPAFLPYYYSSDGTSFACPHISGVVALMLEANPLLTPDEVVTILRQTATPMPYDQRTVGAGYVDAHNAVRAAMGLGMVDHPFDLFPHDAGGPRIADAADDQTGTAAQDIIAGDFAYDAANQQIVYTLTLKDLSQRTPNDRWTMSSNFGSTAIYVTAAVDETTAVSYEYGTIAPDPQTGIQTQTAIGAADSGEIRGNQLIIRVGVSKINTAIGSNVVGTTSTATQAKAQILIGTSVTGGLLLNADSAAGRDFVVQ
ncbi:MAG TPA: S8 family serine peptidase [Blastocatellia bacterium]|jgi:subtilisin family serine protease|nr:S8 family serine peptidase [Blastocatellia bacterium]